MDNDAHKARSKGNRPDTVDDRPTGVLFATEGSTGWGPRRELGDYKGWRSEKDFHHLHSKFTEEDDA
jgi:hypothetical protein